MASIPASFNTSTPGSYDFTIVASREQTTSEEPYSFTRQIHRSVLVVSPFDPRTVILALNSATLSSGATVTSGDVIVNAVRTECTQTPCYELSIDAKAVTPAGYVVKANRIRVSNEATVGGNVFCNQINNAGTIIGSINTPLDLPVLVSLPEFKLALIGTRDVLVKEGKTLRLTPEVDGVCRDIAVSKGGTLIFAPGTYSIRNVKVESKAKVQFEGPTDLCVQKSLLTAKDVVWGPKSLGTATASNIVVYVAGVNGQGLISNGTVVFGPSNTIFGNFYVPDGALEFSSQTSATGAFIAKDITLAASVKITLASGFGGVSKSIGASGGDGPDGEDVESLPEKFALEQNYPNPFNPLTTIPYQLAADRMVELKIYNVLGQLVKTLVQEQQPAGYYAVTWDGTDLKGLKVNSGTYFCRFQAGDCTEIRKMLLIK